MNKYNILSIAVCILFSQVFATAYADDADKDMSEKAKLRREFKTRVEKNDFGDVRIVKFPESKVEEIQSKTRVLNPLTAMFLAYVTDDIDYERLNKLMAKFSGAKQNSKSFPIAGLMEGINRYLAHKSMGLSKVNFSAVNFRQRLEDGVPILCWVTTGPFYDAELTDRFKERQKANSAEEWERALRKTELKKIAKKRLVTTALCIGFNPDTDEYLLIGPARANPIWMTDKELKGALTGAYILRY